MAAVIILGSSMLIGYVSSKIFTNYVNEREKNFTDNPDDEINNIERGFGFGNNSKEKIEFLLENEKDKRKDIIINILQDDNEKHLNNNSNKGIFC